MRNDSREILSALWTLNSDDVAKIGRTLLE